MSFDDEGVLTSDPLSWHTIVRFGSLASYRGRMGRTIAERAR